jgi:hypothetical protein
VTATRTRPLVTSWALALWVLLAAAAVVAHGCHGDEDHELAARPGATAGR